MTYRGADRRKAVKHGEDHNHPEYWTEGDHYRFEDRVSKELEKLRKDVESLSARLTLMLGGLGILAFLIPILAPLIRDLFGVPAEQFP